MVTRFSWPEGKRAAVSLSFDDARASQVSFGIPLFRRLGVVATFYVLPSGVEGRVEEWRDAVGEGHEIGNHSYTHPCSGNFPFSRGNALEEYPLKRMVGDIELANAYIAEKLGVQPTTFAYPCGQTFVGRGRDVRSYVPVVAERFLAGRGFQDEYHNSPINCDLAQVYGCNLDGVEPNEAIRRMARAADEGGWLVWAGHEIGDLGHQTTRMDTLEAICRYARENDLWLDTVAAVARHVAAHVPR